MPAQKILFEPRQIDLASVVDWLERSDPRKVKLFIDHIFNSPAPRIRKLSNPELEVVRVLSVIGFRDAALEYRVKKQEDLIRMQLASIDPS